MGGTLIKTDLGHGRGWAAPKPAASIRRIDAQLGRLADINEAGRSPEQADENRRKWLAYERHLNGGPWAPRAPYALGSDESVHCWGYASDTDDWYNDHAAAVWRDNGWRQTARYPGNKAKDEPWHGEYFENLDNHRNDPAPTGDGSAAPVPKEDDDMQSIAINGKQYGVKEQYITHYGGPTATAQADITRKVMSSTDELHDLNEAYPKDTVAKLGDLLDGLGIPRNVLDGNGFVLNPQSGKYENNGTWSREREILAGQATLAEKLDKLLKASGT